MSSAELIQALDAAPIKLGEETQIDAFPDSQNTFASRLMKKSVETNPSFLLDVSSDPGKETTGSTQSKEVISSDSEKEVIEMKEESLVKRLSPSRKWILGWDKADLSEDDIIEAFKKIMKKGDSVNGIAVSKELGEIFVYFEKTKSAQQMRLLFPGSPIRKYKGYAHSLSASLKEFDESGQFKQIYPKDEVEEVKEVEEVRKVESWEKRKSALIATWFRLAKLGKSFLEISDSVNTGSEKEINLFMEYADKFAMVCVKDPRSELTRALISVLDKRRHFADGEYPPSEKKLKVALVDWNNDEQIDQSYGSENRLVKGDSLEEEFIEQYDDQEEMKPLTENEEGTDFEKVEGLHRVYKNPQISEEVANFELETARNRFENSCQQRLQPEWVKKANEWTGEISLSYLVKTKNAFIAYLETERYKAANLKWEQLTKFDPEIKKLTELCKLVAWTSRNSSLLDGAYIYYLLQAGHTIEDILSSKTDSNSMIFLALLRQVYVYFKKFPYKKDSNGELILINPPSDN